MECSGVLLQLSRRGLPADAALLRRVTALTARQLVHVVEKKYWLLIGTMEVWQKAQEEYLEAVLRPRQ